MDRTVFVLKIKNGMYEEYKRRHDDIWRELIDEFKSAGRSNFSLWHSDNIVIGYYEAEDLMKCSEMLCQSETVMRWNTYMNDVIESENGEGVKKDFKEIFYME